MALQKFSSRPEKPKKGNIRFRLQETFRVVNRRGWLSMKVLVYFELLQH